MCVDSFTVTGTGGFTDTDTYQTVGQPDAATIGFVVGGFNGPDAGPQVAVPVDDGSDNNFLDIISLSTGGALSDGILHPFDSFYSDSEGRGWRQRYFLTRLLY